MDYSWPITTRIADQARGYAALLRSCDEAHTRGDEASRVAYSKAAERALQQLCKMCDDEVAFDREQA